MPDRTPLDESAIRKALEDLPGWSYADDRISRSFEFSSFREAMGFVTRLSFECEAMNHHPEIHNVYNRVDISLNTHDAGGKVTGTDLDLARRINEFSWI
jgi:4a-hydroxytetrahydrobiopterin dehydratase